MGSPQPAGQMFKSAPFVPGAIPGTASEAGDKGHTVRSGSCMEWQKGTKKQKHRKSERLSNQVVAKAQQYPAAGSPIVSN